MRAPLLRGFWKLTWVETKIFAREPMGFIGTLAVPVVVFVALGRAFGAGSAATAPDFDLPFNPAILAAILIAISAVQSLVAIISIYREGGILKRLRATPLSPATILGAHVVVKLGFTTVSLALLLLAGKRLFPGVMEVNVASFAAAVLLGTFSILSLGFVVASLVPTARFAQPIGALVLYPMLALSGSMAGGSQSLTITVVPDSGTGELAGIAGTLQIEIEGKAHFYRFDYTLP